MKNLKITFVIICTLVSFSCKKEQKETSTLIGSWELSADVNGFTGTKTSYDPGNGSIIKFTAKNYERFQDGKITESGTYNIEKFMSLITKKEEQEIVYDGRKEDIRSYFNVNGEELSISVDAYDGPGVVFRRIR